MNQTTHANKDLKKSAATSRISYAFGAFGHDIFYATLSTYFITFITSHLFNTGDAAQNNRMVLYITQIIAGLRIVELIIDPFIGNMIDNTKTRWGKFKPWVVAGGTISSLALLILFTDMGGLNKTNPVLYLIIFAFIYITMDIFYSFKDIGFWSMVPALSFSSEEREKTATFARIGSTIGANIVSVVIMPIVLFFSLHRNGGAGDNRGWFWFAFIVALLGVLTVFAVAFGTHEIESDLRKNTEKTGFKDVLKVLTKNDQLMAIALSYVLYTTGISILNASELYYFTYIMGHAAQFSILGTINTVVGLLSVSLFPQLAGKLNRRNLFFACIAVMLCGIGLFSVAGTSLALVLLAAELFFIPQPLVFLVVLMIITDCVEYGQWKLGHRDEALTLSVRPLLDKFGGAISNLVIGAAAVAAGMTTGATADSITKAGIISFKLHVFAVPFALIILSSLVFFFRVKLTEEKHAEIVEELERTWGHEYIEDEVETDGGLNISAPISGQLIALSDVDDPIFAKEGLGKGFAIKPSDGCVYAPFDAMVRQVFTTRHAVGLVSEDGIVLLIHIGIGTVKLKGTGFVSYVVEGEHVKKGDKLIEFWDPAIKKAGLDDTVIVTVTNSHVFNDFVMEAPAGTNVQAGDDVLTLN
ncbi:Lactose and galactose permease, GPH translocator family [Streptococcus infantarius subsp. infantarius]|uniref:PTS sugar transporter subunit IIA n=1 Tax=Streptococcus infantarius TaxID=102684 RepID=UPI00208E55B3|nr:PTS sugar transporter subunit IIA [Streptococcus infantarius]MCO4496428.1 Lactose and galactose permease, GPH translocator family [Streptococcus infantarius subsp. infantarius]MCO4506275.1 Lactose and galactose permease, GPH translocator family [Streptococcus infantarius subsp. infantarius]MCY7238216.1 PTS sugar transporter subunit IIA [Streptococcus infantarius]